jgi:hypothetical protein
MRETKYIAAITNSSPGKLMLSKHPGIHAIVSYAGFNQVRGLLNENTLLTLSPRVNEPGVDVDDLPLTWIRSTNLELFAGAIRGDPNADKVMESG